MKLILVFILVLLFNCSGQLVNDAGFSSFKSNYPSAEFSACDALKHGSAICFIDEGKPYDNINFKIQGYYKGQIKISSPDCELTSQSSFRYSNSENVSIKIKGLATKSCFIEFVVMPEYPKANKTPIEIHNFKGLLYIKKIPLNSKAIKRIFNVVQDGLKEFYINIKSYNGEARAVFFGCGSKYDSTINFIEGKSLISLSDLISTDNIKSCILNGALIFKDNKIRLTYLVNIYDKAFNKLSIPSLKITNKKIEVTANNNVSIISLDENYKLSQKSKFKFKHDRKHILRVLTVKGRSAIGYWNIKSKRFLWMQ